MSSGSVKESLLQEVLVTLPLEGPGIRSVEVLWVTLFVVTLVVFSQLFRLFVVLFCLAFALFTTGAVLFNLVELETSKNN